MTRCTSGGVASQHLGHARVGFDAHRRNPQYGEQHHGLAGARTDLRSRTVPQPRVREHLGGRHRLRVPGAAGVVRLGHLAEGPAAGVTVRF
ncbi:hypothetical protein ACFWNT_33610 [Streptomyces sp. NPDC058409]|uniref:hypothetical protein n=1 Tax=Streptomyces sp. NPDC058409 TaxID=3346484 RepID=UPI00365902EE